MLIRNSKSLALYSLLAFSQGVLGRPLSDNAGVSRREDDLSLGITGDLLPRYALGKRVDVPVDVPEGDPGAGAGSGPKGAPGSGGSPDGSNDSSGNPPAIGSDQAGSGDSGSGGGGGGGKPPPVGSDQCRRSVDKRCGDPAPAGGQPSADQEKAWDTAKANSAAAIKAQNDNVGNNNAPDSALKDWTTNYQTKVDEMKSYADIKKAEGGGSDKYSSYLKLNPSSAYRHLKFWSKTPPPGGYAAAGTLNVHEAYYGSQDGAIIAKTSYAKADGTAAADRIKWYEFAAKAWSDGGKLPLKWVVRDDVRGTDARNAIDAALIKAGAGNGPVKFKPDDPNFQAQAGTDNGRGPFYLTGRYHNMLGDRVVNYIHIWKDDDGKYYMAHEIGPKM